MPTLIIFHYKGREYDARNGRFFQRDPAEYIDSWNLYLAVGNNPLVNGDPTGQCTLPEMAATGGIAGLISGMIWGAAGNPGNRLKGALYGGISGALAGAAGGVSAFYFSAYGLLGALAIRGAEGAVGGVSNGLLNGDHELTSLAVDMGVGIVVSELTGGRVSWVAQDRRKLIQTFKERGEGMEAHHLLPQEKELAEKFKGAGLDIEDYVVYLKKADHTLKPNGIHTGTGANNWNGAWKEFFANNKNPNKFQILKQLRKMCNDFNVDYNVVLE
jgi:hypothetical protein